MRRIMLSIAAVAVVAGATIPADAQDAPDVPAAAQSPQFEEIPVNGLDPAGLPALSDPDRIVSVMLEMTGNPVAVAEGDAIALGTELTKGERATKRTSLEAAQDAIVPVIERLGGKVGSKLQDAYNGIRVRIPAGQAAKLAELPGVTAVRPIRPVKPSNASAAQFLGLPAVWKHLGFTGKGVKVGIIDGGIDYYHANFGGSGNPADYARDNRTKIEPGTFPTARVAGGIDFVGDDYNPTDGNPEINTPKPDPDPLDCGGHGSHVAGSAAGNGVLLDKSAYEGPYDDNTFKNAFLIGPGIAPEATLYALKIFGCNGPTVSDLTIDALDWAVENDLDVVNLSLGGAFGRPTDPDAVAATNAARAGVVVVAAAGNSGRSPYVLDTPGAGDGALAVAAMDSVEETPRVFFTTPSERLLLQNSNISSALPINATVRVLVDDPATGADESLGCFSRDYAAVQAGEIVVTNRGLCTNTDRVIHATAANAAAVVMINNGPSFPPLEGSQGGAIPFLGTQEDQADAVRAADGATVSIEIVPEEERLLNDNFRRPTFFSAGGPRNGDSGSKPDVTAPGIALTSTGVGTGYNSQQIAGTSMSTALVSGVAALVREARPQWSATQVKAAIMNTGDPNELVRDVFAAEDIMDVYRTYRAGTGLVSPADALATEVVASGDADGGGLSFGLTESTGVTSATKKITLTNLGDRDVTYRLSTDLDTKAGDATVTLSTDTVTVRARGKATVNVTVRVDTSLVPGGEGSQFVRRVIGTAAGNVTMSPRTTGEPTLRVPFTTVVRGTSDISTTPTSVRSGDKVTFTSTADKGTLGPVEVFAWGLSDSRGDALGTDLINVGFATTDNEIGRLGVFAMHAANATNNPSVNEWDVLIDNDGDEVPDFAVIGIDIGFLVSGAFSGSDLVAVTIDLERSRIVRAILIPTALNSAIVQLPFLLSDVGLAAGGQEEFSYTAGITSVEQFGIDEAEGSATFNPFTPPVQTGQFAIAFPEIFSPEITATIDRAQLVKTPVKGWLVVYRFNAGGTSQAQTIQLR